MIFENFGKSLKILEIHSFGLMRRLSRVAGRWTLERSKEAKKVMKSMRGAAVGVPEFGNMSGMMPVWSLAIYTITGGPKSIFGPGVQN